MCVPVSERRQESVYESIICVCVQYCVVLVLCISSLSNEREKESTYIRGNIYIVKKEEEKINIKNNIARNVHI